MKKHLIEQYEVIITETVEQLNSRVNEQMRRLTIAGLNPRVEWNDRLDCYARIVWTEVEEEAETLADEYNLKGIRFQCGDCPLLKGNDDKRRRYCWCEHMQGQMASTPACDEFYKMLARGEVLKNE